MVLKYVNPAYWSSKITATLLGWLLIAAVLGLVYFTVTGLIAKNRTQQAAITEVAGAQVADAVWRGETKALKEWQVKEETRVEEAVEANPEWSDAAVPDDVADSLRKHP